MATWPSSSAADGCSTPTRRLALVTRSPICSLTLSVIGMPSLVFRSPCLRHTRVIAALASAPERQGSGGPSGLQNRQAGAALRLDGSIPSPLRGRERSELRRVHDLPLLVEAARAHYEVELAGADRRPDPRRELVEEPRARGASLEPLGQVEERL